MVDNNGDGEISAARAAQIAQWAREAGDELPGMEEMMSRWIDGNSLLPDTEEGTAP